MKKTRKFKGYFYNVIKVAEGYKIFISLTLPTGVIWRNITYKAVNKKQVKFILRCFRIRYPFLMRSYLIGCLYGKERW